MRVQSVAILGIAALALAGALGAAPSSRSSTSLQAGGPATPSFIVPVTPKPTPTAKRTPTFTATPTRTPTVRPILGTGTPASISTSTPNATRTATPTATPTAFPPVPEESPSPTNFRVYGVELQAGATPDWSQRRGSLRTISVGQKVVLAIYVRIQQLPIESVLSYAWGIRQNAQLVAHHGRHFLLETPGFAWNWWVHVFTRPGTYRFTGTSTMNGVRHHRSAMFTVRA